MGISRSTQPREKLSLYESLIKFKGKIYFRQFTPIKPGCFGIKCFTLAEARSAYGLVSIVCNGKESGVVQTSIMFTVGNVDRYIGRRSGRQSIDTRSTLGRLSIEGRPTLDRVSIDSRSSVHRLSIDCPSTGGRYSGRRTSTEYRSYVGDMSVNCRSHIGQLSVAYRSTVGRISVVC